MGADMRVDGRVAIVTGAGRGIGAAIAQTLAGAGATVIVSDIESDLAEAQAAGIRDADHGVDSNRADAVAADVSKPAECDRLAEETERRHGAVHILVNCAAICPRIDIPDMTEPDYDRIMDTNLKSVYFLSRAAGRAMRRAGWGRIVNMTSVGARTGGMHRVTVYAASKAAIISMTKGIRPPPRPGRHPGQRGSARRRGHAADPHAAAGGPAGDRRRDPPETAGSTGGDRARSTVPGLRSQHLHHRSHHRRQRRLLHAGLSRCNGSVMR